MNHFLRKHFMLYGRTKFTLMALISISIQTIMLKVSPSGPGCGRATSRCSSAPATWCRR